MAKMKIAVKGNKAALLGNIDLIAGTIGQECVFYFDEEWASLKKTITYKLGINILGTYSIENNKVIIPKEVFATAGLPLEIGITGRSDDGAVFPTSWCLLGTVKPGAVTYKPSNKDEDDEIIYDGGGTDSDDEIVYEGGGV